MSIEELKTAVSEALEANLFDLTHIESYETDNDSNSGIVLNVCLSCDSYDENLDKCTAAHCPYKDDDKLESNLLSNETETDPVQEEPLTHSHCNSCKYYDWYLYECTVEHCPYIEDDELDGQQHLF